MGETADLTPSPKDPEPQTGAAGTLSHAPGEGFATAPENVGADGMVTFVEGRDIPGPVPIAGEIAIQQGDEIKGTIIVFGDADLANNALIEQGGNRDLLVNAMNWMADDTEQMGERPEQQPTGVNQFFLSEEQGRQAFWISTVVLPSAFLIIGVSVFVWRRRRG